MDLNNVNQIKKIDKSNVYGSVISLADQCRHAYQEVMANPDFKPITKVKNVVMSGMGGSGLAARVIKPLFKDDLRFPLELVNSYTLPRYVNETSLVILSSYSGNTEETLSTAEQALTKKSRIFSICAGGELYRWSRNHHVPVYKINPIYNPSNQPRMAIGYSIFGQLAMFVKAGLIELKEKKVKALISFLTKNQQPYLLEVPGDKNPAKHMALFFFKKIPVLIAAEHILGALHVTRNQLNENAKTFGLYFDIPELNHHLMEGLRFPDHNKINLKFLFYDSSLYPNKIQKRFTLTKEVVSKNGLKIRSINLQATDKITQVFETLQFGAFWQFYLTMLYGIDPAPIPWVDYFKAKL